MIYPYFFAVIKSMYYTEYSMNTIHNFSKESHKIIFIHNWLWLEVVKTLFVFFYAKYSMNTIHNVSKESHKIIFIHNWLWLKTVKTLFVFFYAKFKYNQHEKHYKNEKRIKAMIYTTYIKNEISMRGCLRKIGMDFCEYFWYE